MICPFAARPFTKSPITKVFDDCFPCPEDHRLVSANLLNLSRTAIGLGIRLQTITLDMFGISERTKHYQEDDRNRNRIPFEIVHFKSPLHSKVEWNLRGEP